MQIPKNVMQYGEIAPDVKIYLEDYVHTFLEQSRRAEVYLVFGRKEERGGVAYYMIYGAERKSDWDRGSYPYFKKYERLGTLEGPADRRVFRPIRGNGITLDGYFVFYEQNEDMQSYMITVKERDSIPGSEEKEEVMEAVRLKRELRRQEENGRRDREEEKEERDRGRDEARRTEGQPETRTGREPENGSDRKAGKILRRERQRAVRRAGRRRAAGARRRGRGSAGHAWTIPELCRVGCMVLALLLVAAGLTSVNRYPDMVAVTKLFSGAVEAIRGIREEGADTDAERRSVLTVEEEQKPAADGTTEGSAAGGMTDGPAPEAEGEALSEEGADLLQEGADFSQAEGQVNWRIGRSAAEGQTAETLDTGTAGQETAAEAEASAIQSAEEASAESEESAAPSAAKARAETEASAITSVAEASAKTEASAVPSAAEAQEETGASAVISAAEAQAAGEPEGADGEEPDPGGAADAAPGETESVQQAIARPEVYVVKWGDNLAAISRRFYGSDHMVHQICDLNGIKNPDQIIPGQKILLP